VLKQYMWLFFESIGSISYCLFTVPTLPFREPRKSRVESINYCNFSQQKWHKRSKDTLV